MNTIEFARAAAHAGMKQATDHAESDCPGWSNLAYAFLIDYAKANEYFPIWMVRRTAELTKRVPVPDNKKAWGSVAVRGLRSHIMECSEKRIPNPDRHATKVDVYRSLIFRDSA